MATLKNTLISLSLILMITACGRNSQGNEQKQDSTKAVDTYSRPFDLSKLLLKENLPELMKARAIKGETKDASDVTLFNYDVLKASDPKALKFESSDFSGTYSQHKNHVLFHYAEDKKTLVCYQLALYDQKQTDQLIELLGKVGTLVFKQTHTPKGAMEIDENGNEIKAGSTARKTYRVWENKSTGITYYLSEDGEGKNIRAELTALNKATQFGKEWISSKQLDWYLNSKSEPL
jgi:hypothetical protein